MTTPALPMIDGREPEISNRAVEAAGRSEPRPLLDFPTCRGFWLDKNLCHWLVCVIEEPKSADSIHGGYRLHDDGSGAKFYFAEEMPHGEWQKVSTKAYLASELTSKNHLTLQEPEFAEILRKHFS